MKSRRSKTSSKSFPILSKFYVVINTPARESDESLPQLTMVEAFVVIQ
ncbi:hypothetical protein KOR42_53150 [Thalassoglobus neptunius]|uniref:Uncharacterized protein n=1 Tax=Thalassoglobus neptunius TaxID=1938619 RepID=A0A5C5V8U1_9PLAN|nr:hypothetical protein [Thalassoglobus neptunius]TWT35006.1 hypothetical protein KOR42_53150 [Thalassoglobus neptunius]